MYGGNPNQRNPYKPDDYFKRPFRPGVRNPYHLGYQQIIGRMAPQPNMAGFGFGTNTTNPRRKTYPYNY